MKRKVKRIRKAVSPVYQRKGVKHHVKLGALLVTKVIIALVSFIIGVYIGKIFQNPLLSIIIASLVAIAIYVLSVLHVIKLFKI